MPKDKTTKRTANKSGRLEVVDAAKFLLILGVVMIHCNLNTDITPSKNIIPAVNIMNFLSGHLFQSCVAAFFIFSGFLMFRNLSGFSAKVYLQKINNRLHSIIIPYILWNVIAAGIFLIKIHFFDYPAYGVVSDGKFDFMKFLWGFLDLQNGYPYDFSLWFLRNLIVFSLLCPVAWIICRSSYLTAILLAASLCADINLHGALYFIIGGWIGLRNEEFQRLNNTVTGLLGIVVWIGCNYIVSFRTLSENYLSFFVTIGNISTFPAYLLMAKGLTALRSKKINSLFGATFFIYAFHALFVTATRHSMLRICGSEDSLHIIFAYIMSFAFLTIISLCAWIVSRTFFPRFTALLTGNR